MQEMRQIRVQNSKNKMNVNWTYKYSVGPPNPYVLSHRVPKKAFNW